ncbi:hypothetical protein imdm_9 [gamma proteobacterium IMCC2047]|nr:hypothetical protein imdm_9 [gamma proteobacterium IMCC2047]
MIPAAVTFYVVYQPPQIKVVQHNHPGNLFQQIKHMRMKR